MKQLQTTILNTDRLLLRLANPDVYKFVFKEYNDYELMLFFGFNSAEELLQEKFRFENGITTFNKSVLYFHLIDKISSTVIGMCGYHTWYLQHARAELFYVINDDSWKRKGIMSEALLPIIKYGFETMKLNRIEAFVGPTNAASHRVMRKFNFTDEGCLRKHYCKDGVYQDSFAFSLLKEEYYA